MAKFKLLAKLPRVFRGLNGMTAVAFNQDGEELDSLDITKRKLKFNLDKEDILQGKKKGEITIKILDDNGDAVNFSKAGKQFDLDADEQEFTATISSKKRRAKKSIRLKGTEIVQPDTTAPVFEEGTPEALDENSGVGAVVFRAVANDDSGDGVAYSLSGDDANTFSVDPKTGVVTINENADFESKEKYNFNVVATDASGNSATKPLELNIADIKETGDTITLSTQEDVYSEDVGGQVIGTDFVQNNNRLTTFSDIVNASAGSLNTQDSLTDSSSTDVDLLNLSTNTANNLQTALAAVSQVVGIENLDVSATNDNSANANLNLFQGLKSLSASGTFTNQVVYQNYLLTGARSFDFSGVNTGGVNFTNGASGVNTSETITLTGSNAADVLQANNGAAQLNGLGGIDTIQGSALVGSTITGGTGRDDITLQAANSVDVVSMVTTTTTTNGDDITGFVGANTNANAADLLRFDASTFNTYTAGDNVTEVLGAAANASQSSGLFIVDEAAEIAQVNTQTGEGTLALDTQLGVLLFSSNGDFTTNSVDIGSIDDFAGFAASANVDIV